MRLALFKSKTSVQLALKCPKSFGDFPKSAVKKDAAVAIGQNLGNFPDKSGCRPYLAWLHWEVCLYVSSAAATTTAAARAAGRCLGGAQIRLIVAAAARRWRRGGGGGGPLRDAQGDAAFLGRVVWEELVGVAGHGGGPREETGLLYPGDFPLGPPAGSVPADTICVGGIREGGGVAEILLVP